MAVGVVSPAAESQRPASEQSPSTRLSPAYAALYVEDTVTAAPTGRASLKIDSATPPFAGFSLR